MGSLAVPLLLVSASEIHWQEMGDFTEPVLPQFPPHGITSSWLQPWTTILLPGSLLTLASGNQHLVFFFSVRQECTVLNGFQPLCTMFSPVFSPILPTCFIHCAFSGLALTYPFSGHQLFLVSTLTNSLEEEKECGCRHETVPDASHGSTETGKAEKMSSGESRASLVSFQIPISSL